MSTYETEAVVNHLLDLSKGSEPMTPLKLQKILYYAYGWNLVFYNEKLFHEPIMAWKFGTVVNSVYHYYKDYGSLSILPEKRMYHLDIINVKLVTQEFSIDKDDNQTLNLLSNIWKAYGSLHPTTLSKMGHTMSDLNPWSRMRLKYPHIHSIEIPDAYIKEYFDVLKLEGKLY
jgi:uncharacterized phage-associated protein